MFLKFYKLGNELFDSGKYSESVEAYDKSLELAPYTPEILYRKGEALYKIQKFIDAAAIFWVAYLYMRFRKEPLLMCGRSLEMAGLSFQACRVFSMVSKEEMDIESTTFYLSSLIRESRIKDALELLPKIDSDVGFNAQLLRGKIFHELGFAEEAEKYLTPLIDYDLTGKVIDRLIGVYAELKKYEILFDILDLAINRFSRDKEQTDYYIAQKNALHLILNNGNIDNLAISKNSRIEIIESAIYIKKNSANINLSGGTFDTFKTVSSHVMKDGLIAEFGVRNGHSINILSNLFQDRIIYGFDSFEGIPDAWGDEPVGSYTTAGTFPKVEPNVKLIHGWFNNTLPDFAKNYSGKIALLNIDCDIYSSTKDIFNFLGKFISKGSIIVFDEYINNKTWRDDEFKAFQEWVSENKITYEYISVSFFSKQVAVRILNGIN